MRFDEAKKRAIVRFLRVIIPQIPAFVAVIGEQTQFLSLPVWVAPVLMFVGAVATALDKLLRALGVY